MTDFWPSCGHHFLDRDESGGYIVTDDFLKIYLARPEVLPPSDACAVERNLHSALLANPRRSVTASEILAILDADARENWEVLIAFRDHLLAHKTLEAGYVDLIRRGVGKTPPLFMNQLVHAILRNALDRVTDPRMLRAGELFFRTQRITRFVDRSGRGNDRGRQPSASVAAGFDARVAGRIRNRGAQREQCLYILAAQ
jgi:hypothetical protein